MGGKEAMGKMRFIISIFLSVTILFSATGVFASQAETQDQEFSQATDLKTAHGKLYGKKIQLLDINGL